MIKVEGYKAFYGTMLITPLSLTTAVTDTTAYELTCAWLYKPESDCWYGDGRSFPENICTIVEDKHEQV